MKVSTLQKQLMSIQGPDVQDQLNQLKIWVNQKMENNFSYISELQEEIEILRKQQGQRNQQIYLEIDKVKSSERPQSVTRP